MGDFKVGDVVGVLDDCDEGFDSAADMLGANQPAPALDIDPRWEELVILKTAVAMLKKDLDTERQRASRLADEAGEMRSDLEWERERVQAFEDTLADRESTIRSHERTIQRLRDQIIKLGARPV